MFKKIFGWAAPLLTAGMSLALIHFLEPRPSVERGLILGISMALVLSLATYAGLKWSWNSSFFYWVWGVGFLIRMFIFLVTALVVHRIESFHWLSVMLSLALGSMIFMLMENATLIEKRKLKRIR